MSGSVEACAYDLHLKIVGTMFLHSYLHVTFTLCWKVFEEKKKYEKFYGQIISVGNFFELVEKTPIQPLLSIVHN